MRRYILTLGAILLLLGAFWGGAEVKEQSLRTQMIANERQMYLSSVLGCAYAAGTRTLLFVNNPEVDHIMAAHQTIANCEQQLDIVGRKLNDNDKTDEALAEAKLFFDGYRETLKEIITRRVKLIALYEQFPTDDALLIREVVELEMEQSEQLEEANKFLNRISQLIIVAW